ncbi:DUF58 domain-containing protein [Haloprofundus sp. MHR1]|uniref:DUF58 domain-containing protein n=1 Tax=Haloprofundus sp. MHR1 TaxID=2572921 RepID=UPI00143D92AE|nr:DUF58 domain-containing protein [Haloprofundus sp. MHR1]
MRLTREGTVVVVLLVILAVFAVLLERITLIVAVAAVGAWLLTYQWSVVNSFIEANETHSVALTPHQSQHFVDEDVDITLQLTKSAATDVSLTVVSPLPVGASGSPREDRRVSIAGTDSSVSTAFTHQYPVAGQYSLPAIELTFADRLGLFIEEQYVETETQIQITPHAPRSMHVGQGGERIASAYGDTPSGQRGGGLLPLVLREYTGEDSARQIDWKATARLGTPYITEYEQEADYQTILVVDHRTPMADGPRGQTKFDYVRDLALGFLEAGFESTDSVGMTVVEEDSYRWIRKPTSGIESHQILSEELQRLEGPTPSSSKSRVTVSGSRFREEGQLLRQRLSTESTAFETTLRHYLRPVANQTQTQADSLQEALTTLYTRRGRSGSGEVLLFTDDSNRHRLLNSISTLRRHGYTVGVFLTPTVLFESQNLTDIAAEYERYVSFEEFRKRLTRLSGVSAFEVGPRDRLSVLLSNSQSHRQQSRQD